MVISQKLYEGGYITYMRTDSVVLSEEALTQSANYIINTYGEKYSSKRHYANASKNSQEAHEAIRPTNLEIPTITSTPDNQKIYNLIWTRTIASQMANAIINKTIIEIKGNNVESLFYAEGEDIEFEGFLKIYGKDTISKEKIIAKCRSIRFFSTQNYNHNSEIYKTIA